MKPKTLTLVFDSDTNERAYLDGVDTGLPKDETLYSGDIVEAAGGHPVVIEQINIHFSFGDDWPRLLSDARSPNELRQFRDELRQFRAAQQAKREENSR